MITPRDAVALLERADPVDPERIADQHDIAAAHDRVHSMIASGAPADVGRWPARIKAVPLVAVVAAALAILLSALPGAGNDSALDPLNVVAAVAANQPSTVAPPGRYFHLLERANSFAPVGQHSNVHISYEWWVAANGSGRLVYRSAPWGRGSTYSGCGCHQSGNTLVVDREFGPGRFADVYRRYIEIGDPHPVDPASLPTTPIALKRRLERTGDLSLPEIAWLLADPMDTPALRSALFRLAGRLPGVTLRSDVIDPAGRTGEAMTAGARPQFRAIFDPRTSQILAWEIVLSSHGTTWMQSRTFLERGIVSSTHAGP
jgi:hypothetical protein